MARTDNGTEFYLVEVTSDLFPTKMDEVETLLARSVREGDGVFRLGGKLFIAFAADVRGSAQGTRRLLMAAREHGFDVRIRLAPEPLPEALWEVAATVATGQVTVLPRIAS